MAARRNHPGYADRPYTRARIALGIALYLVAASVLAQPNTAAPLDAEITLETLAPPKAVAGVPFEIQIVARYTGAMFVQLSMDDQSQWGNLRLVSSASTDRARTEPDGRTHVERVFSLRVVSDKEGTARLPALTVSYTLGEETVRKMAPAARIDVMPAPVPMARRLWFRLLAGAFVLGVAVGTAFWATRIAARLRRDRATRPPTAAEALREEIIALRQARLSGQPHLWFRQAEQVLYHWCALRHGLTHRPASPQEMERALQSQSLAPDAKEQIIALAQRCYEGKFSPATVTTEELERIEQRLLALVEV